MQLSLAFAPIAPDYDLLCFQQGGGGVAEYQYTPEELGVKEWAVVKLNYCDSRGTGGGLSCYDMHAG